MYNAALFVREDAAKHPVLKSVMNVDYEGNKIKVVDVRKDSLKEIAIASKAELNITSDPIVFVVVSVINVIASFFLRTKKKKWIFLSLEMFEFQRPNSTILNKLKNWIFKISHYIALKYSYSVFPNSLRREYYVAKNWTSSVRSKVIPNYISQGFIDKVHKVTASNTKMELKNKIFDRYSLDVSWIAEPVAVLAGSIDSGSRGINVIVDAFNKVSGINLIVAGPDKGNFFGNVNLSSNIKYIGSVDRDAVIEILSSVDCGVAYYSDAILNTRYAAPVKLHEYNMLGLTIICNKNEGVISEWGDKCVYYDDSHSLAAALLKVKEKVSVKNQVAPNTYENEISKIFSIIQKN